MIWQPLESYSKDESISGIINKQQYIHFVNERRALQNN